MPEEVVNYSFKYLLRLKNTEASKNLIRTVFSKASSVDIGDDSEIAIITDIMKEGDFLQAIKEQEVIGYIRVS